MLADVRTALKNIAPYHSTISRVEGDAFTVRAPHHGRSTDWTVKAHGRGVQVVHTLSGKVQETFTGDVHTLAHAVNGLLCALTLGYDYRPEARPADAL